MTLAPKYISTKLDRAFRFYRRVNFTKLQLSTLLFSHFLPCGPTIRPEYGNLLDVVIGQVGLLLVHRRSYSEHHITDVSGSVFPNVTVVQTSNMTVPTLIARVPPPIRTLSHAEECFKYTYTCRHTELKTSSNWQGCLIVIALAYFQRPRILELPISTIVEANT